MVSIIVIRENCAKIAHLTLIWVNVLGICEVVERSEAIFRRAGRSPSGYAPVI